METKVRGGEDTNEYLRQELSKLEPARARRLLRDFMKREIATLLKLSPDEIDADRPLDEIGMDSLASVELKLRLEAFGVSNLPISI